MIVYEDGPLPAPGEKCPECGAGVRFYVEQWDEAEDGTWLPVPLVECDTGDDDDHRYWQCDWEDVRERVERWARKNVVCKEAP